MDTGLILASKSPRRKEILSNVGLDFEIIVSDTDESVPEGTLPFDAVKEISSRKAIAVRNTLGEKAKGKIILSADTVVVLDGKIIGKPKDEQNAIEILTSLSGRNHVVYTGFTIIKDDFIYSDYESTDVYFRSLSEKEIKSYVASGEPMDKAGGRIWSTEKSHYYWEGKAGGYGIQDPFGMKVVRRIVGDYYNVMGLPVSALCRVLKEHLGIDI